MESKRKKPILYWLNCCNKSKVDQNVPFYMRKPDADKRRAKDLLSYMKHNESSSSKKSLLSKNSTFVRRVSSSRSSGSSSSSYVGDFKFVDNFKIRHNLSGDKNKIIALMMLIDGLEDVCKEDNIGDETMLKLQNVVFDNYDLYK